MDIDTLYTYGAEARYIADSAGEYVRSVHSYGADERDELTDALLTELHTGDTVLFKASNGMRLGELAQELLDRTEEPQR